MTLKYEYPPSPQIKSERSLQELTLYAVIYCVCNENYPTSSVLLVGYIQRKCVFIIPIPIPIMLEKTPYKDSSKANALLLYIFSYPNLRFSQYLVVAVYDSGS